MTARACPICGEPATPAHRPFCSLRCANVDLQRWLTDGYRLGETGDDTLDEAPAPGNSDEER